MKKASPIINLLLSASLAASCTSFDTEHGNTGEFTLNLEGDFPVEFSTKAIAVTSIPQMMYWSATTGPLTSETGKYASTMALVPSGGKISTGIMTTEIPETLNWYVSNTALSYNSGCTVIPMASTIDVIAGMVSSDDASPSVTLKHIFARTGTLTLEAQWGYELSNVSWTITGKDTIGGKEIGRSGTYNISRGEFTEVSSPVSNLSISSSSDLYLMPGVYTISVSYTLSRMKSPYYRKTFTKSADVTLVEGAVNNITGTAVGAPEVEVEFALSVSLSPWSNLIQEVMFQ